MRKPQTERRDTMNKTFTDIETSFGVIDIEAVFIPEDGDGWHTPHYDAFWEAEDVKGYRLEYDDDDNETRTPINSWSDLTKEEKDEVEKTTQKLGDDTVAYYQEMAAEAAYDRYTANQCGFEY
jgi:hypothetical protein